MRPVSRVFLSAFLFLLLSPPSSALAGAVIGQSCSQLGESTMTQDKKNLVSCLYDDAGTALIYKAMTESGAPAGTIAFFALSECPSGYLPANGENGTLDLRGEFVRGLDSGRGVDSGRVLGSSQLATRLMVDWRDLATGSYEYTLSDFGDHSTDADSREVVTASAGYSVGRLARTSTTSGATIIFARVRPRNIALLACQKS